jgi:hypothetical protein
LKDNGIFLDLPYRKYSIRYATIYLRILVSLERLIAIQREKKFADARDFMKLQILLNELFAEEERSKALLDFSSHLISSLNTLYHRSIT